MGKPFKILVVDDERGNLVAFENACPNHGNIKIYPLLDPTEDEIKKRLEEIQPDIVFADLHMSFISGIEVMRYTQAACPNARRVIVSHSPKKTRVVDAIISKEDLSVSTIGSQIRRALASA